jgi:hypothetical protein
VLGKQTERRRDGRRATVGWSSSCRLTNQRERDSGMTAAAVASTGSLGLFLFLRKPELVVT